MCAPLRGQVETPVELRLGQRRVEFAGEDLRAEDVHPDVDSLLGLLLDDHRRVPQLLQMRQVVLGEDASFWQGPVGRIQRLVDAIAVVGLPEIGHRGRIVCHQRLWNRDSESAGSDELERLPGRDDLGQWIIDERNGQRSGDALDEGIAFGGAVPADARVAHRRVDLESERPAPPDAAEVVQWEVACVGVQQRGTAGGTHPKIDGGVPG